MDGKRRLDQMDERQVIAQHGRLSHHGTQVLFYSRCTVYVYARQIGKMAAHAIRVTNNDASRQLQPFVGVTFSRYEPRGHQPYQQPYREYTITFYSRAKGGVG